jgi:hypothetical protein
VGVAGSRAAVRELRSVVAKASSPTAVTSDTIPSGETPKLVASGFAEASLGNANTPKSTMNTAAMRADLVEPGSMKVIKVSSNITI